MFYKPDECGLDFSGVPILSSAARFVLARLVFFFIIVFASSSRFFSVLHPFFPISFLLTRNFFKIMQIRHPCHYFFALPRREANFCTNRSALKINVGWRHFILREKRSITAPSYLGIERLSRMLLPQVLRSSSRFMRWPWDKEPLWFSHCTRVLIPIQRKR